ncbi:uncharacterized protein EDB93DRAFT_885870 [Suillus bovinus]|uniref:uncharacterized protein n=1 Tax=Suillus bovinus TaxID=48563 RepID=UPI001B86C0F2|nr:uncharacterized protein EDB93DRAFT_885870 [Suillus bovinus]KAG2133236.1 hypothetical protein EDB93DRAFT_885870 [Suillus bovinus]
MTIISNDPSWWPTIYSTIFYSYFVVIACAVVIYDWGLMFGQEVELIWRQRWSIMTVLYLVARYVAIAFSIINMLISLPTVAKTGEVSRMMIDVIDWMNEAVEVILSVIAIARLYAMYQGSRKVLIFLVVTFLAIRIPIEVMGAMVTKQVTGEEYILSGIYRCRIGYPGNSIFLGSMTWILATVWEVLTLCLAIWIAVKHLREIRTRSTGGIIGDCFTVLMQTHMSYFASFLAVSSVQISLLFPQFLSHVSSQDIQIYICLVQIFHTVQLSVLGPRLILSVREYHAKLVACSDTATDMP